MKPAEIQNAIAAQKDKYITVTQKNGIKIHGVLVQQIQSVWSRPPAIDIIDRRNGEIVGRTASHKVMHYITQRVYICNIHSIASTIGDCGPLTDELLNAYRAKTAQGATKASL